MSHSHTEHGTTISAAALAAQLTAAQEANTRLIARVVELEHERDRAMAVVSCAVSLVGYARLAAAVASWEQRWEGTAPPEAHNPRPHCWNCGLPLAGAHLHDEVIITNGPTRVSVHRACADHLMTQGWWIIAQSRGLT